MGIGISIYSENFIAMDYALKYLGGPHTEWSEANSCLALHAIRSLDALGHLRNAMANDIAGECGWFIGDADEFISVLCGTGWLQISDDSYLELGPAWAEGVETPSSESTEEE